MQLEACPIVDSFCCLLLIFTLDSLSQLMLNNAHDLGTTRVSYFVQLAALENFPNSVAGDLASCTRRMFWSLQDHAHDLTSCHMSPFVEAD